MIESLRGRVALSAFVAFIGLVWIAPNFLNTDKIWWPTKDKLKYGLDIQGGLHLGLGVDINNALKEQSNKLATQFVEDLKEEYKVDATVEVLDPKLVQLRIKFNGPAKPVEEYIDNSHRYSLQVLSSGVGAVEVQYFESYLETFKKGLIDKAREILTNRIDQFGVSEPSITVQGEDRIIVQLPGIKNTEQAKEVLNKTAQLKFMMVDMQTKPEDVQLWVDEAEKNGNFALGKEGLKYLDYLDKVNEALKDKLPKNTTVRFQKSPNVKSLDLGKFPYLLKTDQVVSGASLEDAYTSFNQQTGQPVVIFRFDGKGAQEFGKLTSEHVKENMAIVLDGVVVSAPNINGPILGGTGEITLGTNGYDAALKEANLLSLVLKSGALPVRLDLMEERTVGPSLGQDSIQKGKKATLIGLALVFLFMLLYYRVFGIVADIALVINVVLLFAVLSSLKATLTLPGIAGIALTVGMAVDANIIIFERVREELRKGASLAAAVKDGFGAAFWTIFDSNITTIATCLVLMYYGTGPIRGFAVTLTIGLLVSMFTAVFVSRTMLELLVVKWKLKVKI